MKRFGLACLAFLLMIRGGTPGMARPADSTVPDTESTVSFQLSRVVELAQYLSTSTGSQNAYAELAKLFFLAPFSDRPERNPGLGAFEENRAFIYALGSALGTLGGKPLASRAGLIRRVIVLRPSMIVVDDELPHPLPESAGRWRIYVQNRPMLAGLRATTTVGNFEVSWETLLPHQGIYRLQSAQQSDAQAGKYFLEVVPSGDSKSTRFLTVFSFGQAGRAVLPIHPELIHAADQWNLTVSTAERVYHLSLPPAIEAAGEIAISTPDGKTVLDRRPLPSGVLPHGPEGSRLLELWDSDYRGQHPPIWDIGHPADELVRVISSGKIRACRALDLCCGSGNDAIYLASRHFDVTAVDVAPTALAQAQQKAQRAGVSVRWLLADVLAPPNLPAFDFIYDRGCYHVVRDQNLEAYLATLRRFSHPGTQFLLLASKRGDHASEDGSTGVTEEELNFDFVPLFDIEWLRAYRLESSQAGPLGPPAWSVLMCRKAQP